MPSYVFKSAPELMWSVIVSMSTVLLLALAQLDPSAIVDWKTWAVGIGAGAVRAGAGAVLDWFQRHRNEDPVDGLVRELRDLTPDQKERLIRALEV